MLNQVQEVVNGVVCKDTGQYFLAIVVCIFVLAAAVPIIVPIVDNCSYIPCQLEVPIIVASNIVIVIIEAYICYTSCISVGNLRRHYDVCINQERVVSLPSEGKECVKLSNGNFLLKNGNDVKYLFLNTGVDDDWQLKAKYGEKIELTCRGFSYEPKLEIQLLPDLFELFSEKEANKKISSIYIVTKINGEEIFPYK